jgi:hypothetical protein
MLFVRAATRRGAEARKRSAPATPLGRPKRSRTCESSTTAPGAIVRVTADVACTKPSASICTSRGAAPGLKRRTSVDQNEPARPAVIAAPSSRRSAGPVPTSSVCTAIASDVTLSFTTV